MNKNFKTLLVFSLAFAFVSCEKKEFRTFEDGNEDMERYIAENNITVDPSWTGLYYIEENAGTGDKIEFYDSVVLNYKLERLDGFILAENEDSEPVSVIAGSSSQLDGMNETLFNMKNGGRATSVVPYYLAFKDLTFENLEAYSPVIFKVEILEHFKGPVVEPYVIDTLQSISTGTGLTYYQVHSNDTLDETIHNGNKVTLHYTGFLEDGRIFDSSVKRNSPFTFYMGNTQFISGWNEALLLMKKGEKFRLILPPALAYGDGAIPPFIESKSTLLFDIEILDVD